MSISSSGTRKSGPYTGNGATSAFPFTFKVFQASDVLVVQTDTTPADHALALNTDYTVALNANQDANPGGTVNMVAPPPSGYLLTIGSNVPELQSVTLTNNGGFYPSVINSALDYLTILVQQISEKMGRALVMPFSTNASGQLPPVAPGQLLGWKADGTGIDNIGATGVGAGGIVAANLAAGAAGTALSADTQAASTKITPGDADELPLFDSAAQFSLKKFTWANLKAALLTYFNGVYLTIANAASTYLTQTNAAATYVGQANPVADAPIAIQQQSIYASVASNALTLGLNQGGSLAFRNANVGSGVPSQVTIPAGLSLTVPSGATLGTISNVPARLVLLAINNAGTMELAIVNQAGSVNLDETTLINTTAISAAAMANNVIYSTTARTGAPFRVVGYVELTETTAGTWSVWPSLVQGIGGQAGTAMQSLAMGQTWQVVTRTSGTTYYNTTGKPITLLATQMGQNINMYVSATLISTSNGYSTAVTNFTVIIPPGQSYSWTLVSGAGAQSFMELR